MGMLKSYAELDGHQDPHAGIVGHKQEVVRRRGKKTITKVLDELLQAVAVLSGRPNRGIHEFVEFVPDLHLSALRIANRELAPPDA